ncbi:ribosomal protection-like ABC-F family protein [Metabacillus iocasae]|uniref:Macrolide transport system ATP-binding/permease protein n=1 Tax=Priestia iocasae TaxID=2291674 RepID=A0ABS2QU24_9BACI|nr:ABC-F type ribosomal protection protein [Metabacillus iocasae]MBM7702984.1 macrolide transport system ATP-binding/permease protein [Metabacillus iocasae]
MFIEAKCIEKSYGDRLIVKVDHLQVYSGDRIGIVGKNGEGKSTLLRMIVGEIEPDGGNIQRYAPLAYIPQLEMGAEETLTAKMKSQWDVPKESHEALSGGEITRQKIAAALASDAKVIIADEPTSHLDVQGIEQLERELTLFKGSVIIISHDQEFLTQVCTTIWEIEDGNLHIYEGNYRDYVEQKQHIKERQAFEYEHYVKEKQRLEQAAMERSDKSKSLKKAPSRMGNSEARLHKRKVGQKKAKLDRGVKAIETRIEKLERKEKPKEEERIVFDVQAFSHIHSKRVIAFQHVKASVGQRMLFGSLNGSVKPGSKVAIIGQNGVGKSTLLNLIHQRHENITIAKPAKMGYFHQQLENLDEEKSILENVKENSRYTETFIRTVLSRLLFKREDVHKKVHMLSGGERVKAALATVFLGDYNVLLLDEPTNYLDLHTKESLQEVLKAYPGTILFVTHDRYFVKELATHVVEIEEKRAKLRAVDQQKKSSSSTQQKEADLLAIEMELTDTISKLSLAVNEREKEELEGKYTELLKRKRRLTEAM